jgi:hypothetical protein
MPHERVENCNVAVQKLACGERWGAGLFGDIADGEQMVKDRGCAEVYNPYHENLFSWSGS